MTEVWNREGEYSLRSRCEKFMLNVGFWHFASQDGVEIEIKNDEGSVLHFFSIELKKSKNERLDTEG